MENLSKNLTFLVPSGFEVTIREQDGEDDDIISKIKNANDGSSVNKFVAGVIINCGLTGGKVTANDVLKWKNRDKYYVILKSRIFSLGSELNYKQVCPNTNCAKETPYDEDLSKYDRDFSKLVEETDNGFKYQIQPYPEGEKMIREITTSSGKQIRYKYLNGLSEKKMLEIKEDEISKNTELIVRDIEWLVNDKWQKLQNFKPMSATDMKEIRTDLAKNDLPFDAISECKCPYCGNVKMISLLTDPGFFFPQEI